MFLLLENFVSGIRLELMYIPLMVKSIRSSLTQLHGFNLRVAAIVHRNHFFYLYQKNKSSESKVKLSCSTWATQAAPAGALDISKIFDRAWHAVLLHKLKSYGISGQIYGLISSFLSKTASCGSEWQVFTRRLAIHWRPSSWCYLWYCYLCWYYSILSVIRHLICGNNLNWLNCFCLTSLITQVLLMWSRMGLFLRKTHLLRRWGWPSLPNWIGALTLSLFLKLPPRKLEP